jgi:hypothetical protein
MHSRTKGLHGRGEMKNAIVGWTRFIGLTAVLAGCSDQPTTEEPSVQACQSRAMITCACSDGTLGKAYCSPDGQSVGTCQCQTGHGGGGQTSSAGGRPAVGAGQGGAAAGSGASGSLGGTNGADGLPCDVKRIIQDNCSTTCHGSTRKFGAPMSLVSASDFHVPGKETTESVGQLVLARINDTQEPMPPAPNELLSAADRLVLENWIESGAPGATCNSTPPQGGAGGMSGTSGTGGTGGSEPLPPDVTCYQVTARASAAGDKYSVPTSPDLYQCFNYAPPWGNKKVQVVSARPIIDNEQVIHHWILYNSGDAVTDGTNGGCVGAHPNAAFVVGWAPGGEDLVMPPDVGLRTEPGGFSLEVHYNNEVGAGQLDASGAEICVTEKLRPKEAAVHWLGSQSLNKLTATGTCTPINQQPVTIISSSPHMHLQGRHMKTVINRKNGGSEILIDKPFDFNTQVSYPTPAVVNPGDTLTTTCTFATPTPFGQGTNEEMCYNFVMAYPAGELAQFLQILRKYDCTGL